MTLKTLDLDAWRQTYLNVGSSSVNRMSTEQEYQAYAQRVAASNSDTTETVAAATNPFQATAIYTAVASTPNQAVAVSNARTGAQTAVSASAATGRHALSKEPVDMTAYLADLKTLMARYV